MADKKPATKAAAKPTTYVAVWPLGDKDGNPVPPGAIVAEGDTVASIDELLRMGAVKEA